MLSIKLFILCDSFVQNGLIKKSDSVFAEICDSLSFFSHNYKRRDEERRGKGKCRSSHVFSFGGKGRIGEVIGIFEKWRDEKDRKQLKWVGWLYFMSVDYIEIIKSQLGWKSFFNYGQLKKYIAFF